MANNYNICSVLDALCTCFGMTSPKFNENLPWKLRYFFPEIFSACCARSFGEKGSCKSADAGNTKTFDGDAITQPLNICAAGLKSLSAVWFWDCWITFQIDC